MTSSTLPSLLTIHVTALRWLNSKWLTTFCLLWIVVICLIVVLPSGSVLCFQHYQRQYSRPQTSNLSMAFLALFFQFLVPSSSFSALHLSALWLKLILSPTSLLLMTQLLQSCPPDQIYCLDQADVHLWPENLDDYNNNKKPPETEWQQDRGSPHQVK